MTPITVLVYGGRAYSHQFLLWAVLDRIHQDVGIALLIDGAAPGADTLGHRWAIARGVPTRRVPAEWGKYGRRAGPIRNHGARPRGGVPRRPRHGRHAGAAAVRGREGGGGDEAMSADNYLYVRRDGLRWAVSMGFMSDDYAPGPPPQRPHDRRFLTREAAVGYAAGEDTEYGVWEEGEADDADDE